MAITKTNNVLVEGPFTDKDQFERSGSIRDDVFSIVDQTRTKQLQFECSGLTNNTTMTVSCSGAGVLAVATGFTVTDTGSISGGANLTFSSAAGKGFAYDVNGTPLLTFGEGIPFGYAGAGNFTGGLTYTVEIGGNWIVEPTTVHAALDELAARVKALEDA